MKVKTIPYKGSKRKLIDNILSYACEIKAKTVFDGFSGTGIVSANLRNAGFIVEANDLNYSSYVYGRVFLEGYDKEAVREHIAQMNNITPVKDWLFENYSGTVLRHVRGEAEKMVRPLGLTEENAMIIDGARNYIDSLSGIDERDRNALIFSCVLALNQVFNNPNDQKSSLKEWSKKSLKRAIFAEPTLVSGPVGKQHLGDIFDPSKDEFDFIYYDPPYTHGVLYGACYHLNDSLCLWDKPEVNHEYAVPRPDRAVFRGQPVGAFYSSKSAPEDFDRLLKTRRAKRTVLSYSNAPRNSIAIEELIRIAARYGHITVHDKDHKLCTQFNSQNKISKSLREYFIIIDA